ncbi:MAG: hypothetical protein FRX48_06532 [Lasallia pustulata]|uniref:Cysteine-rich transmembrane CYSTM domain-containing protein n=1 Tax=Lasallia pustulata TaxID=136370 RepID=A0A1W5DC60_9LECA|nr:MAG: hypothetical protein FRX48_06532 [Lasallia pustulata]SLM40738.1 hypothetical protein LPUS_11580 [Lasallia pustulata]
MSNQGYYGQPQAAYQGGGGYPPQGFQPQPGFQQQQMYPPQPMYNQGPPPQQVRQQKSRGCIEICLATLCCCFVAEEGCDCCAECCECAEGCC